MTNMFKTVAVSSLAALAVFSVATAPAEAGWHRGWGGPAALGIFGGLAAGAIIASQSRPYGNAYYGYNDCYIDQQPVFNHWGRMIGYRDVRVCN